MMTKSRSLQKGFSTIEMLPVLVLFLIMGAFSYGFFTITHTAILSSIGARTYGFDTIANRSEYLYFHPQRANFYYSRGYRLHAIRGETSSSSSVDFEAASRNIAVGWTIPEVAAREPNIHNEQIKQDPGAPRWSVSGVNPIWIKTPYGLCINVGCGD